MGAALLVIDVQRGLFASEPRPFDADAVVERINQLAARARAALIRAQYNATLPGMTSFGSVLGALPAAEIDFSATV